MLMAPVASGEIAAQRQVAYARRTLLETAMPLSHHHPVQLPSGHVFDPERPRSLGVLDQEELAWCRHEGVPIGYDAAQQGWVSLLGEDDLSTHPMPLHPWPETAPTSLVLRPWRRDEAEVLRQLLDDPEVWRWLPEPFPGPLTPELARDLIEVALLQGHHIVRAVEHAGRVVGQVRLLFDTHEPQPNVAEVSYWIGRAYWGRGFGGRALRVATQEAFEHHPSLQRVIARVHPSNLASAAILSKCGYTPVQRDDGWLGFARKRR
jgi:RimJ/RimL family protein N-acetyltransferase